MSKEPKVYTILCADFECGMCNGGQECPNKLNHGPANVWLAGYKELYSNELKAFTNIEDWFFHILDNVEDPVVYFHNGGKYDTFFIYRLLITYLGFRPTNTISKINVKERKHFKNFSSDGTNYDIQVFYKDKKMIIRDSYRLITKSIEALGGKTKGKFNDFEKYGHKKINTLQELSEQELHTFNEDIDIMRKHLQADLFFGKEPGKKKLLPMTIASLGYKDQKDTMPFIRQNLYNKLSVKQWDYFINFFRGGIVYTNPKWEGKKIYGIIRHYDINSLYPFVLKSELLPFGIPFKHKPLWGTFASAHKIFIKSAVLKENKIPYIGVYKHDFSDDVDEMLAELLDDDAYNYPPRIYNLVYYVWDFELEWIKEQYNIDYEIQQTDYFQTKQYMKEWVEKYELLKIHYTKQGDKVNRECVKLILNGGGFGKYGQKRVSRSNVFKEITVEEKEKLRKNSIVYKDAERETYWHFTTEQTEIVAVPKLKYNLLSAFVTAKARIYISKFRQKYWEYFIYGDTDDIYLLNMMLDEEYLDITPDKQGNERIGQFGLFSFEPYDDEWTEMFIHGSKKYWVGRKDRHIVKFAGFTYNNTSMTFDEFTNIDTLKDAKTFKNYTDGVPTIHKRDGVLRKTKKKTQNIRV